MLRSEQWIAGPSFMVIQFKLHGAIMIVCTAVVLTGRAFGADPPDLSSEDTISIQADEAWEDEQPDIIHFAGNFRMRAADWSVSADRATLFGNLDDPQSLVLEGTPARVRVTDHADGAIRNITGSAPQIEYGRSHDVITLRGGAVLRRDDQTLRSAEIQYQIDLDTYQASGPDGVRIEVAPDNRP